MRPLSCLFAALVFLAALPATAGSGALLPSCENDNCSSPNYGLGTAPKKPSTSSSNPDTAGTLPNYGLQPVAPQKKDSTTDSRQAAPSGATSRLPAATLAPAPTAAAKTSNDTNPVKTNISPGGTVSKDAVAQQNKMNDFMRAAGMAPQTGKSAVNDPRLQKYMEDQARAKIKPPLILNDTDSYSGGSEQSSLPYGMSMALAPGYLWGAKDVSQINGVLGFTPQQIPSSCQLRLDGSIKTDKGTYRSIIYAGQRSAVKFDGVIKEVSFVPRAVCNPPSGSLPQTGGIIRKVGDKLSVQLRNVVSCPLPQKASSSLEVQYGGDGTAKCQFN
ncbi:MAG: hypothetical protein PHY92_06755 [Alphaproteobacteria bacterium]|nr:hypothetical protein [Alphaproteobacteria bacterium]